MGWDDHAVRIELHQVMRMITTEVDGEPTMDMQAGEALQIYPMVDGKCRVRKPAGTLLGASRADLLRQIADWIEQEDDPSLAGIVTKMQDLTA